MAPEPTRSGQLAYSQQVREPGSLEVIADRVGQPLVLAEHHPAQQRGVLGVQAALETALGAAADGVERARDPAAAPTGTAHAHRLDRATRPARPLVGVEATKARDPALDLEHLADAGITTRERLAADPEHRRLAGERPGGQPDPRHRRTAAAMAQ